MAQKNNKYVIDGYSFPGRNDYEKALKEKEAISYIAANTNMADMKAVLKIYNKSVEKQSFQTAVGLEFVNNMRKTLISSGIVSKDTLMDIPVPKISGSRQATASADVNTSDARADKYKLAYENALAGRTIRNIVIAFLTLIIIAMLVITFNSKYSVFTYFTDYKADMENELIDKYESWKDELDKREKELDKREKALK
ncbi:MAG TPA: hypothetical protein DCZ23_09290 [Lachnospiraceae bacterium]|nr:hypothetical protein [Lachnospiraceae bacterium]